MAVFTRNCNLTFKADKPIVCYVYNDDGLYAGDAIKSDTSPARKDTLYNNFNKDLVTSGYVGAYLSTPADPPTDKTLYRCMIEPGTDFIVSDNLREICATEVTVTNRADEIPPLIEVISLGLLSYLSNTLFAEDGQIGCLCTKYGKAVKPTNYNGYPADIVGIVCNNHDNTNKIIGLKEVHLPWCVIPPDKRKCVTKQHTTKKAIAHKDLNGYLNCRDASKHKSYSIGGYPAISYCLNYSAGNWGAGRWFLGSVRDIVSMIRENMLKINVALAILKEMGVDCDLLQSKWYWTSTEFHELSAWTVVAENGFLGYNAKTAEGAVRAMTMV